MVRAWGLVGGVCLLSLFAAGLAAAGESPRYPVGSGFEVAELGLPVPCTVVARAEGDVTGDGVADTVLLVGHREAPNEVYWRQTWVVVQDGQDRGFIAVSPGPIAGGYGGELSLCDFTGDGAAEMLVGLPTGGSGGMTVYSVLSDRGGAPRVLFDQESIARGAQFSARFRDRFVLSVFSHDLEQRSDIDIGDSKTGYIEAGVYDSRGQVLKAATATVSSYSLLQAHGSGVAGAGNLVGFQAIRGLSDADVLGRIRTVWSWDGAGWRLTDVEVRSRAMVWIGEYVGENGTIRLRLLGDRSAEMVQGSESPVTRAGSWESNKDGTAAVSLEAADGKEREALTAELRGDLLTLRGAGAGALVLKRTTGEPTAAAADGRQERTFRGSLVAGPEASILTPCGSDEKIWVVDETGELWRMYDSFAVEPYEPVFVEVKGRAEPPPAEGPGKEYGRQIAVTAVRRAAREGLGCDEDLSGIEFKARGNEPFWNVTVGREGITFFDISRLQVQFEYVAPAKTPGRWMYYTTAEKHWILVVIDERPCRDSMSGEYSSCAAEVLIDGQRYAGCAYGGDEMPE